VSERRIQHVREVLSPGQAVEAVVLAVEPERRRISLSLREAQEHPIPPSRMTPSADEPPEAGPPREPVKPPDDSPTPMQLAFRRAREAAERRREK
jgi:transcriptional accessory protein Tex/SPT6